MRRQSPDGDPECVHGRTSTALSPIGRDKLVAAARLRRGLTRLGTMLACCDGRLLCLEPRRSTDGDMADRSFQTRGQTGPVRSGPVPVWTRTKSAQIQISNLNSKNEKFSKNF